MLSVGKISSTALALSFRDHLNMGLGGLSAAGMCVCVYVYPMLYPILYSIFILIHYI
jgi:hypothetical protein